MASQLEDKVILQWNIGGFFNRLAELQQFLCHSSVFCIALQETWFPVQRTPALRGYRGFYRNRDIYDRASGGVAVYVLATVPSAAVPLQTTFEAVAVRIRAGQEFTVCSIYLPPDATVSTTDVAAVVAQLPPPFLLLGDFNAHHPLWGGTQTTVRGRDVETLLSQQDICLLNTGAPTHFCVARGTYSAIDLSLCSPTLLPHFRWRTHYDLCGSDHFPILVSHLHFQPAGSPPRWSLCRANWRDYTSTATFPVPFLPMWT